MGKAFTQKNKRQFPTSILITLMTFAAVVVICVFGFRDISKTAEAERLNSTRQAVMRATVQCYAIEGRFPQNLEYLKERYGLILDYERFIYVYDIMGSNLMPEIQVFRRVPNEGGDNAVGQ